ncbi:MAG: LamG-like jellyroll fold domain-containing protein [Bacteroidota bacterium]
MKFLSINLILIFFSGSILLAADFPVKNKNISSGEQTTYFVGFYLYEPTITAPADVNEINEPGECFALKSNISLGTATAGGSGGTITNDAPAEFSVGQTIVTWTITDDSDNTATDTQLVTISDNEDPTITAPIDLTVNTDSGSCMATNVSLGTSTTDDNCGVDSVTNNAPTSFPLGETIVTWAVTDNSGNTATATQKVIVEDNENPTITAPSGLTVNTDSGSCVATNVSLGTPTTDDNCGIASVTNDAPNSFSLGETTVTWTVTDNSGNTATANQVIKVQDNEKPVISHNGNQTVNNDAGECGALVSVNASATDNCGVGEPTGIRSDGQSLNAIYPVGTTSITWTVTDDNGIVADEITQTITVSDNENPIAPSLEDITWGCEYTLEVPVATDNCDPQVIATTNDPLTYSTAGNHIVTWTFTDDAGNQSTATQTLTIDPLEVSVNPDQILCYGAASGKAEAVVTGGVAPYTYDWGSLGTGSSKQNLEPGNYSVTVTDDNGCTTTASFEITQPDILNAAVSYTDVTCFGANDGTISISNPTGGFGQYEFSIDNGTTWQPSGDFAGLTNATYQVLIRDADNTGCEIVLDDNLVITQPEILAAEIISTNVTCNGSQDGTIDIINPSGGHGQYQYSINGGTSWENSGNYSNLSNGSYNIQIRDRDEYGCFITLDANFVITQPEELSIGQSTITDVTCFGGNDGKIEAGLVNGGTSPYHYSIDNIEFNTTGVFENLIAGNYTLFIVDDNSCAIQMEIIIEEPDELSAEINSVNVACHGDESGEVFLSDFKGGSGNYQYRLNDLEWKSGNETFQNLPSGNYEIQIRDASATSCFVKLAENFEISQPDAPLEVSVDTTRTLNYGSATGTATANPIGGTPGYTYEWRMIEDGNPGEVLQRTKTATELIAGEYEVSVYDNNNCVETQRLTIIDNMEAEISSRSVCEGEDDITEIRTSYFEVEDLTAVGGVGPYKYEWDFGADAENRYREGVGEFQVFYSDIGNKTITLTITDDTGAVFMTTQDQYVGKCYEPCGKSENFTFDPTSIYIGNEAGQELEIDNDDICDSPTKKYIYIKVDKSANAYNPYIELIFTLKNSNNDTRVTEFVTGCRSGEQIDDDPTDNKENLVGDFIRLTADPIEIACGDNLEVDNFYITWTNVDKKKCGQNNNAFCYSSDEPVVLPTPLSAEATPTNILCKESSTGSIITKVSGGFAPYGYNITGPNDEYQTSDAFYNLSAGTYTVYVQDARGNRTTTEVTINEPLESITAETSVELPVCYGELGTATVTANGGTPFEPGVLEGDAEYKYLWNDPAQQTTATADSLFAGKYTVTVIDANGCQEIKEVTITEPEQLPVAETGEDQVFECGFNTTTLEANDPVTGIGTWTIIEEESAAGGVITSPTIPNSEFKGGTGTYTLRWTIADENGNCATYSDMQVTFSEACNTLDFDGVDDHIVIGDHLGFTTGSFTMEAWVKPHSVTGTQTVISKRNSKNLGQGGFDLIINSGTPTFRWGSKSLSSSSKITENRWYHIAVIFQNGEARLFVDGIRIAVTTNAANPTAVATPFLIGAMYDEENPDVPANYFHGWIEEVRLWKKALSLEQLRFLMNQHLEVNASPVKGTTLPMAAPGTLNYTDLAAYYPLVAIEAANGITKDLSSNGLDGHLRNIITDQENTAPLPYVAAKVGDWWDTKTWQEPLVWDPPSSPGITGDTIAWNIVRLNNKLVHNPASTNNSKSIDLLALLDEGGTLDMQGANNVSGNGLTITRYFKLDGVLDLNGESQLIQSEGSEVLGSGHIERDQQGTASSFNYNYWSSPVLPSSSSTYTVAEVMFDGTIPGTDTYEVINFGDRYAHADGPLSSPIKISNFWINVFRKKEANQYSQWERIGSNPTDPQYFLKPGEGYTMKGTHWVSVKQNKLQNYTFKGFPNNGDIELTGITADQNYLIGNPYPSAVNAIKFIEGHLQNSNPSLSGNVFNGTIYYWDHYSGQTHYLEKYVGGYAAFNLSGGLKAISNDDRINDDTNETGTKTPGPYIPVGQGFFINTASGDSGAETNTNISGGTIKFKNEYRVFASEANKAQSLFLSHESPSKQKVAVQANKMQKDTRYKIRLQFNSPKGYLREILVTADRNATNGIDLGYDAPLLDNSEEDMYWMINDNEFVIQGVPNFYLDQILPIGLKIAEESEFGIKISKLENLPEHVNIYLHDKIDDSYFDLTKADFKASLSPEIYNNRYEIVFYNGEEPEEDALDDEDLALLEMGYSYNSRELHIKNPEMLEINKLVIYSISGQEVHSFLEVPKAKLITLELDKPLSSAVYVVRAYTNKGEIATQVIIKQ